MADTSHQSTGRAGRVAPRVFGQPGTWVVLSDVSPGAKALYTLYCAHVEFGREGESATAWPSLATIGGILAKAGSATTERTISKWNRELEELGAIDIDRQSGKHHVYTVHQIAPEGYTGYVTLGDMYRQRAELKRADAASQMAAETPKKPVPPKKSTPDVDQGDVDQGKNTPPVPAPYEPESAAAENATDPAADETLGDTPDRSGVSHSDDDLKTRMRAVVDAGLPRAVRDRMTPAAKREFADAVTALLRLGATHRQIVDVITGEVNEATRVPVTACREPFAALTARLTAQGASTHTPVAPSCPARCEDGVQLCSSSCPTGCDGQHPPAGGPCAACRPDAVGRTDLDVGRRLTGTTRGLVLAALSGVADRSAAQRQLADMFAADPDRPSGVVVQEWLTLV